MSPVTNVWRQLVQRRLWPVAIVLIAGLAAVPLMLAEDPEPAVSPPPAQVDTKSELATTPIVAPATPADRAKRRQVLGDAKNPFARVKQADPAGSASDSAGPVVVTSPTGGTPGDGGGTGSSGGGAVPSTGTPAPTTPATPAPAPKKYELNELTVRFGSADDVKRQSVKRLQPLPSAELPVLIYMGVLKDGKTAVFLVDHGVTPIGDGECKPSPEECETIRLKVGETEFLDVADDTGSVTQQYQLDLIKIHKSTTASASKANASSKAGTRLLKARVSADGPTGYRWNAATGNLEPRASVLRSTVGRVAVARLP
jgi:hypothetical protein